YLAADLGSSSQIAIYDVSCIVGTGPCSLGAPLSTRSAQAHGNALYLTYQLAGSTPYLYAAAPQPCVEVGTFPIAQREWLYDVSNPASPHDMTPATTESVSALYYDSSGNPVQQAKTVNYWSYYYRETPTGFNQMAPRHIAFD